MRLAGRTVVPLGEKAAERRLNAQHGEVSARDQQSIAVHRLTAVRQVHAERPVRGDTGEHGLEPLEVPDHRVAEDRLAVAGLAARLRAGLRSGRTQVDQPPGFGHWQGAQEHLVEEREDGGIRPDPQGEGDDGDHGDQGRAEQRAQGR